jgi:hypothetical protein
LKKQENEPVHLGRGFPVKGFGGQVPEKGILKSGNLPQGESEHLLLNRLLNIEISSCRT